MVSLRTAVDRGFWHRPSLSHEFFLALRDRQDFRDLALELDQRDAAALR
jgi:hypothetical protein